MWLPYCGFPLITRAGQAIGSLCAIDSRPRQWSEFDVAALRDLADILVEYIELQSRPDGDSMNVQLSVPVEILPLQGAVPRFLCS